MRYTKNDRVFISGSSHTETEGDPYYLKKLPSGVERALDKMMKAKSTILVGDCFGIDSQVQSYLASKGYKNVEIYVSGKEVRNDKSNGKWKVNHIDSEKYEKDSKEWHATKDVAMTKSATQGLAIVLEDGSNATKRNVDRLRSEEKDCYIFELHTDRKNYFVDDYKKELKHGGIMEQNAIKAGEDWLAHHGIPGQKWGVQNGPPYPLDPEDHSAAEKKANVFKDSKEEAKKKKANQERVKKMLKAKAEKKKAAEKAKKKEERTAKKEARKAKRAAKEQAKFDEAKSKAIKKGDINWAQENAYRLSNEEINAIVSRQDAIRRLDSTLSPAVAAGVSRMNKMNEVMRTTTNTISNINGFIRVGKEFKDLTEDKSHETRVKEINSQLDKTKGQVTTTVIGVKNGVKTRDTTVNNIDRDYDRTFVEKDNKKGKNDPKPKDERTEDERTEGEINREKEAIEAGLTEEERKKMFKHSAIEVGGSLQHSAKGTTWEKSNHKYIYKKVVNGKWRYYYYVDPTKQNLSELDKEEAENAGVPIIDVDKELAVKDENYRRTNSGEWWNKKGERKKAYEEYNKARSAAADIEWYEDKKKLKHSAMEIGEDWLMHHGILGQKWGVQNGPPYPLDPEDHSAAEKKAAAGEHKKTFKETMAERKEAKFNKAKEKAIKAGDMKWARHNANKLTAEEIKAIAMRRAGMERITASAKHWNDNPSAKKIKDMDLFTEQDARKCVDIAKEEKNKKLKHSAMEIGEDWLMHHGILGQKWGVQNGPPYPLDPNKDYSKAEKEEMVNRGVLKAGTQVKRLSTRYDEDFSKEVRTYVNVLEKDAKKYRNFYVDSLKRALVNGNPSKGNKGDVFEAVYQLTKDVKIADFKTWDDMKESAINDVIDKESKKSSFRKAMQNHPIYKMNLENDGEGEEKALKKTIEEYKAYVGTNFDHDFQRKIMSENLPTRGLKDADALTFTKMVNVENDIRKEFINKLKEKGYGGVTDSYSTRSKETKSATIIFDPGNSMAKVATNVAIRNHGADVIGATAAIATAGVGIAGSLVGAITGNVPLGLASLAAASTSMTVSPAVTNAIGKYKTVDVNKAVSKYTPAQLRSKIAYYKESGTNPGYLAKLEAELERKTK